MLHLRILGERVQFELFYYVVLIVLIIHSLQVAQTIGFIGDGYVELPSLDLGRSGDLSFSFRTRQEDALLVLAKGTAPQVDDTVCVTLCFLISYYMHYVV